MRKIKFIKSYKRFCILLDDWMFESEQARYTKLTEVLNLFQLDNLFLKSSCFIEEGENLLEELACLVECNIKKQFTKTKLFSKKKYSKVNLTINGVYIAALIEFIVKHDISWGIDCCNKDGIWILGFVINDNDGTCITFNSKMFNIEEIKSKVIEIFAKN